MTNLEIKQNKVIIDFKRKYEDSVGTMEQKSYIDELILDLETPQM